MAISDRINEMYTHVGEVYDTITNVDLPTNKNIQNIPSTMRSSYLEIMNNGIDKIWNNWEKVEGTGESLSLNNTEEAPMKIDLKGNTSQEGTPTPETPQDIHVVSGDVEVVVQNKNLFDKNNVIDGYRLGSDGTNFSNSGYSVTDFIKVKPSTNFYRNRAITLMEAVCLYDKDKNFISRLQYGNAFTTTENTYYIKTDVENIYLDTTQLELGSTATPYTPHQEQVLPLTLGNIELCKIGDYQDSIKKSTGKNLFDKSTITSGYRLDGSGGLGEAFNEFTTDYIEVEVGATYIRNYGSVSAYTRTCFYDENKTFISKDDESQSITIPNNVKYIRFSEYLSRLDTLQFEKGNQVTPYEPYGTEWYLNKKIGKVVLDGSENWNKSSKTTINRYYLNSIISTILNFDTIDLICNYFVCITQTQSDYDNIGLAKLNANGLMVNFDLSNTDFDTLEKYKTWLSTHNTTVYYVLATPTYTEITDSTLISQLEALNGARSYTTQTNINQVNNDKPFILDVTALKQLTQ